MTKPSIYPKLRDTYLELFGGTRNILVPSKTISMLMKKEKGTLYGCLNCLFIFSYNFVKRDLIKMSMFQLPSFKTHK